MKRYRNLSGDAGVVAYDYGHDWIRLRFVGGEVYEYPAQKIGAENLACMKRLADSGAGLTTFLNTHPHVKAGYTK